MDHERATNSIFIFIFAFVFGILISSLVFISPLVSVLIIFIGIALLVVERVWENSLRKEVLFLFFILLSFGLGALRYSIKDFHELLVPETTGIVVSEPEARDNTTRFVLLADNGEKVLVSTDLYSHVQYGDRVEISGKLTKPGMIESDNGGRAFDYAQYLSKDDIYHLLNFAKVEIISSGHGNFVKASLLRLKKSFVTKSKEILAEPYASLLAGLVVSGREAMPKDILEEFRRAGVIHIVVLSGYNIAIIAESIRKLFEKLFLAVRPSVSPKFVASMSVIAILIFVIMTGAEATVVRASIMVLVVIAARMFGRSYSAFRALLAAGFLMLIWNPKILVFDPSFQLSFLATLALIYIVPIVEQYLPHLLSDKWGLRTVIATTLATQVTVLPLLVYLTGDFSLVSLPANILILLIIPLTMLMGFLATVIAYISSTVALPLAYMAHLLLAWILGVSNFLGNLSFASITIPSVSVWLVAFVYLAMIIFIKRFQNSVRKSAN